MTRTCRRGVRRPARLFSPALLAALALASPLGAQLNDARVGAGVRLDSYGFSDAEVVNLDRIELLTFPVSARVMLGSSLEFGVGGAYARGTLTRQSGVESELSGLIDTEVRLTARLAGDRFRLGVVALLPTGSAELENDELDVAGLIASDLLPFAISNWGTGGGIGLNAAAALPLAEGTAVGLSAGYVLAQEYEPLAAESFSYRPGNQLHLRAALDHIIAGSAKASLQVTYQQFSADQYDDSNIYQTGERLQAVGTLAFAAGARGSGIVYAGYLRRLEGEYTNPLLGITPTQDLLYAGGSLRQPLSGMVLVPSAELRVLGNDEGIDQGYTITAGTGVELALSSIELVPSARIRFGRITVRADQESGFTGMELGLTLRNRTLSR